MLSCWEGPLNSRLVWLGVSGMTSKTDDLEQVLRQNLKLRRELGAAVAEAESEEAEPASSDDNIAKLRLELKLRHATDPAAKKGRRVTARSASIRLESTRGTLAKRGLMGLGHCGPDLSGTRYYLGSTLADLRVKQCEEPY